MSNPDGFVPPPCPECGTALDVDWLDVSITVVRDPVYIPGKMTCPTNEHHKVSAAYSELSWPADLTDDDRQWLRTQRGLAS